MLRMQMENENVGTSSKQIVKQDFSLVRDHFDGDISSVVYGNNMFQRWYENQEFASTSTEPVVT
ncbi:NAC domain-containing protein 100-like, partial [Trifolium medium]|nr:NAC domain-containing protein 100-like [Trifolium medium]